MAKSKTVCNIYLLVLVHPWSSRLRRSRPRRSRVRLLERDQVEGGGRAQDERSCAVP